MAVVDCGRNLVGTTFYGGTATSLTKPRMSTIANRIGDVLTAAGVITFVIVTFLIGMRLMAFHR